MNIKLLELNGSTHFTPDQHLAKIDLYMTSLDPTYIDRSSKFCNSPGLVKLGSFL